MNSDGKIIIGTEINETGVDKGIKNIEKKIKKLEDKAIIEGGQTGIATSYDPNLSKEEEAYLKRLRSSLDDLYAQKEKIANVDKQVTPQLEEQATAQKEAVDEVNKWVDGVMKLSNGATLFKLETTEAGQQVRKIDFDALRNSVDGVGKSVTKTTRRLAKMALAVFGIRSAFNFVRNAINTIAGDDEQLKADIDYMKSAIAYTLEPLVRGIVNLAKQLLFYIQYIIQAWTGKNIFENANKSLGKANKKAKDLKKTVAGFDELNIVSDNGKDEGVTMPSFDLTKMQGEVPSWIQWIADNGPTVVSTIAGIVGALTALRLGLTGLQSLGIGIAIVGILTAISSLISYLKNPTWKSFGKIIEGIGIALLGLALTFSSVPLAVAGAIVLITGILARFWDDIEKFINNLLNKIYKFGDNIMTWLSSGTGILMPILEMIAGTVIGLVTGTIEIITDLIGGVLKFVRSILDGILMLFRGDFKNGIATILRGIANLFIDMINTVINAVNTVVSPIRGLVVAVGKVLGKNWTMQNIKIPKLPRLNQGTILNNPGKGVPVAGGSAIAGEAGREAYLPLSDPRLLEELGSTIGKYVRVDNYIDNYMDSRKIDRIIATSRNVTNFAMNR